MTVTENLAGTEINKLLESCETIGTIGSPSSTTRLTLNIMESEMEKKLIGELAIFKYNQDKMPHYTLGQITEVILKNDLLEESTFQSIARMIGSVKQVSGIQDVHIGTFSSSAVFCHNSDSNLFEQSIMGTVPSTGTPIFKVSNKVLDKILEKHKDQLFYLGRSYGSNTKYPMWFKHFGPRVDGGTGEAFHMGIFGTTGSGKSTLALAILMAYSRHKEMGLLVLDPVGEFTKKMNRRTNRNLEGSNIDYRNILKSLGKEPIFINVRNLVLDRWDIFNVILRESYFFRALTVEAANKTKAIQLLENKLKNKIKLADLWTRDSFDIAMGILRHEGNQANIFSGEKQRSRLNAKLSDVGDDELYAIWKKASSLFKRREGAHTVNELLTNFSNSSKPIVIVDLSYESVQDLQLDYYWSETIQTQILISIVERLSRIGQGCYHKGESLNTLVVLDEAHRFAGKKNDGDNDQYSHEERLKTRLIDYARTTRKYGLGWMFISTSLSSIDRDILRQLRIIFFGFGLSFGNDSQMLKEMIPENNFIELYQSFSDPASALNQETKQFPFMCKGPVSPLSFAGSPLFINALSDEDFVNENFGLKLT